MKGTEFTEKIGDIDNDLIMSAAVAGKKPKKRIYTAIAAAACLCICAAAIFTVMKTRNSVIPVKKESSTNPAAEEYSVPETVHDLLSPSDITETANHKSNETAKGVTGTIQKGISPSVKNQKENEPSTAAEFYSEPDFDEKSLPARFSSFVYNGNEYVYTGERKEYRISFRKPTVIESRTLTAADEYDKTHSARVNICTLEGFGKNLVLGVIFEDDKDHKGYASPYVNMNYIPSTFGEFAKDIDFYNTVSFGNLTLPNGVYVPVSSAAVKKYLVNEKAVNTGNEILGTKATVTVSCEELNFNNKALYIYSDGHISTNLIGYLQTYNIGKSNADAFLKETCNMTFGDFTTKKSVPTTDGTEKTTMGYNPE